MKTLASFSKALGLTQLCLFVGGLLFFSLAAIFEWRSVIGVQHYYYGVIGVITWLMMALWFWFLYRFFEPKRIPVAVLCTGIAACLIKCLLEGNIYLLVGSPATAIMKWIAEIALLIVFLWLWKEYSKPAKVYILIFTLMPLIANLCRLWGRHADLAPSLISLFGLLDALSIFFGIAFFLRFSKQLQSLSLHRRIMITYREKWVRKKQD